jgi:hypothetical protein
MPVQALLSSWRREIYSIAFMKERVVPLFIQSVKFVFTELYFVD